MSVSKYLQETLNGGWAVTDGNNYRNQLELYFLDCPAALAVLKTAPFTPAGLAAVVQAYH